MGTYVYQNKVLHINRYRRKLDGTPYEPGNRKTSYERRRRIKDSAITLYFDRRQNRDPNYAGPERRSGIERRSGVDRRLG